LRRAGRRRQTSRGWGLSELQKLEQIQQEQRWFAWRDLVKSRPFPYVLIAIAMLAYVVTVWQWF